MKKLCLITLLCAFSAHAREHDGVKLPDEITLDGHKLVLNGMGTRVAIRFGMHFPVYVGGLYLEKPSNNAKEILDSPEFKKMQMVFLRTVGKGSSQDAWQEAFEKNCTGACATPGIKAALEKMKKEMTDVGENEKVEFVAHEGKLEVSYQGKTPTVYTEPGYARVIFSTWLQEAPNEELKAGLLGLAPTKK